MLYMFIAAFAGAFVGSRASRWTDWLWPRVRNAIGNQVGRWRRYRREHRDAKKYEAVCQDALICYRDEGVIRIAFTPPGRVSTYDPLGQRGYIQFFRADGAVAVVNTSESGVAFLADTLLSKIRLEFVEPQQPPT